MDWGAFAVGACVATIVLVLVATTVWGLTYNKRHKRQVEVSHRLMSQSLVLEHLEVLVSRPRYKVTVTDWGPDFTGQDGILHRWRWVVADADQEFKRVLGLEPKDTPNFVMLGNAPTYREAWSAAMAWVEQQQNPPIEVIVP